MNPWTDYEQRDKAKPKIRPTSGDSFFSFRVFCEPSGASGTLCDGRKHVFGKRGERKNTAPQGRDTTRLEDAPAMVVPLLDGLIWRSRLTSNGYRCSFYYAPSGASAN